MTLTLGTEAIDVLRRKQWRAGRRTMLLESGDTNHCTRSEDLSLWTQGPGTGVRTPTQADPKGGTTAFLLDDQDAAVAVYWESPSFAAYVGAVTQRGHSWFVKAGTGAAPDVELFDFTAGVTRARFTHTMTAGVPVVTQTVGTGAIVKVIPVTTEPGHYRVLVDVTGIIVANAHRYRLYPAGATAANLGSTTFWGFHAHSTCTPARQYHGPTVGSSLTSGSDVLPLPWLTPPGALTMYARYYEMGAQKRSTVDLTSQRIVEISGATSVTPRTMLVIPQPFAEIQMQHFATAGTKISATVGLPTLAYGDKVEAMGVLYPDGSAQVFVSVNGAVPLVGGRSAGQAFDPAWSPDGLVSSQRIKPFSFIGGTGEVERLLVTPGVYTFAEAQSLAG